MLTGGQQVGRAGVDSSGAERRVRQRGEVRVVATQLRVDGLRRAGVQRGLQGARGVLDIEPRPRISVHVPPRGRAVGDVAGDGRVKTGLVPRFVRVRHPHPRVKSLRRCVDFGYKSRLSGLLRRDPRRVGEQTAVLCGKRRRGRGRGGQAKGAVARAAGRR